MFQDNVKSVNYTLDVENLKSNRPEIFFSEWDNKWNRIRLTRAESPVIKTLKDTIYYIFKGFFEDNHNFANMPPEIDCLFWISKQCFDKEIIRHINFWNIDQRCAIDISFDMKRTEQRKIHFRNMKFNNIAYI